MNAARRVAEALAKVDSMAGQSLSVRTVQSVEERVENLLRDGPYKAYVIEGDPLEWGGGGALVTILMEQKGGLGDCIPPLRYYEDGLIRAMQASRLLGDVYIEIVNPAVAVVYRG